jgi:hypothetical protein
MPQTLKSITIAGQKFEIPSGSGGEVGEQVKLAVITINNYLIAPFYIKLNPNQTLLQWFNSKASDLQNIQYGNSSEILYEVSSGGVYTAIDNQYSIHFATLIIIATYLGIRESLLASELENAYSTPQYGNSLRISGDYEKIGNVYSIIHFTVGGDLTNFYLDYNANKELNPTQTLEEYLSEVKNETENPIYIILRSIEFTTQI